MNDSARATGEVMTSAIKRFWWIPVLVGLIVGVVVGTATGGAQDNVTSGLVNTRVASDLPNERIDLVKDVSTAMSLSPVLEPVAEDNDLTLTELRGIATIEQVNSSSFARITVTSPQSKEFREDLIQQLLDSATAYLTPPQPPKSLRLGLAGQTTATKKYYNAIANNDGIRPDRSLERLENQLLDGTATYDKAAERIVKTAQRFEALEAKLRQATSDLNAISATAKSDVWSGPENLEVTYEVNSQEGLTSQLPVRRGVGAGLAAAFLISALIALAALARRRRG